MAELKTKPTKASVKAFIDRADEARREDCRTLSKLMEKVTKTKAVMWGESIVGFGSYEYTYPTGNSGEWMLTGFSPRKRDLTVYIMAGFDGLEELLAKLGPHKIGKSCLYLKRLDDIDLKVLEKLVAASVRQTKKTWA